MIKFTLISLLLAFNSYGSISILDPAVKFTGFKFTNKTPVSGTFKKIDWTYSEKATTVKELLKSTKFTIDSYSIDAGKVARNNNITNALFKNWGAQNIIGNVKSVDANKNIAIVNMTVGKNSFEVPFNFVTKDKKTTLTATIDLIKVGFKNSFAKLAKTCAPWHKGEDGKTKTWSEVDLEVVLTQK